MRLLCKHSELCGSVSAGHPVNPFSKREPLDSTINPLLICPVTITSQDFPNPLALKFQSFSWNYPVKQHSIISCCQPIESGVLNLLHPFQMSVCFEHHLISDWIRKCWLWTRWQLGPWRRCDLIVSWRSFARCCIRSENQFNLLPIRKSALISP